MDIVYSSEHVSVVILPYLLPKCVSRRFVVVAHVCPTSFGLDQIFHYHSGKLRNANSEPSFSPVIVFIEFVPLSAFAARTATLKLQHYSKHAFTHDFTSQKSRHLKIKIRWRQYCIWRLLGMSESQLRTVNLLYLLKKRRRQPFNECWFTIKKFGGIKVTLCRRK